MQSDEKIIKYLENEISPEERKAFEEELSKSDSLREQFNKFLSVKDEINNSKNYTLGKDYFDSILPEFRNKLNHNKSRSISKNISYAFGVMLVLISSVFIFNRVLNDYEKSNNLRQFTESLDEHQKIELLEDLNGNVEEYYQIGDNDLSFTEIIQNDLLVNNEVAEVYDINYVELIDQLSPTEADEVYNEILNTNFNEVQL